MLARADYIIRLMSYRRDDVVPVACRWDDARSVDMVSRTCSLAASAGLNYVEKRPASVAFAFFTYHERPTRGHSEVPKVSLPLTAKFSLVVRYAEGPQSAREVIVGFVWEEFRSCPMGAGNEKNV